MVLENKYGKDNIRSR